MADATFNSLHLEVRHPSLFNAGPYRIRWETSTEQYGGRIQERDAVDTWKYNTVLTEVSRTMCNQNLKGENEYYQPVDLKGAIRNG